MFTVSAAIAKSSDVSSDVSPTHWNCENNSELCSLRGISYRFWIIESWKTEVRYPGTAPLEKGHSNCWWYQRCIFNNSLMYQFRVLSCISFSTPGLSQLGKGYHGNVCPFPCKRQYSYHLHWNMKNREL